MTRVMLIHWNEAEARERVERLEAAGFDVTAFWDAGGGGALRDVAEDPPDAFVIDLSRLPSHGREVAAWLRARKATRGIPLIFLEGDVEKVARIRALLPDATYATWRGVKGVVARAMRHPPAAPANPGVLAGYSGTPLPKKLGIKAGMRVALLGAPDDFARTLGDLPEGATLAAKGRSPAGLVMLFARSRSELERRFPSAEKLAAPGASVWIAWPKKASGVQSDLSEKDVRAFGLARPWVDYKVCAIDATWSGLLFARRAKRVS